ncbi:MAG TPA: hypothetical protein VKV28_06220 [Candidatus Binataceae bacterium]|nr:hypothetical protein [Candidatus Binataceae bacterium]
MTTALDTLKLAKRLREAHFTQEQAEALSPAMGEAFTEAGINKYDLAARRHEMNEKFVGAGGKMADLKGELAQGRSDFRAGIAAVRQDMAAWETRMLPRMGARFGGNHRHPGDPCSALPPLRKLGLKSRKKVLNCQFGETRLTRVFPTGGQRRD